MCGIAGVVQFRGIAVKQPIIDRMTDVLEHRGPDGRGTWLNKNVGIGHRRLSVIDTSIDGKQPFVDDKNSVVLTYNGELYNFKELRKKLQSLGHVFRSRTDTEVILHSYLEWGRDCLQKFRGMFAFAIWDQHKKELWLARDRIGIKPLFYSVNQEAFLFGSEIKSILAYNQESKALNIEGMAYYLGLNYVPGEHTLFSGVQQLLPGFQMVVTQNGETSISKYWDMEYEETDDKGEQYYVDQLDHLLEQTVKQHLISDVPNGLMLSGGLDSSSLAFYMSKVSDKNIESFSIDFQEKSYSESYYSTRVSKHFQSNHHCDVVSPNAIEQLPNIVWHAEEPTADSSMLAYYYLCENAKKKITVAIGGDGADEILAGYETYSAWKIHALYKCLPSWLTKKILKPLVGSLPASDKKLSLGFKLNRFLSTCDLSSEEAHASWRIIFDAKARVQLLQPLASAPAIHSDFRALFLDCFRSAPANNTLNRMLYVDTKLYLPSDMLTKVDRMSMAHGLEVRVPFLDHHIVDFANTVPAKYKLKLWLRKKHILKQIMHGRLPKDIVNRKKAGFNLPISQWIRSDMKEFVCDHLSESTIKSMGVLNHEYVTKILEQHFAKTKDFSFEIWGLLIFSLWFSKFKPRV